MTAFALVSDIQDRIDWTLDSDETRMVNGVLDDASELARYYGLPWPDPDLAPRIVRTLVIQAVVRYVRNPDGYVQSRAGDETTVWSDKGEGSGSVQFTDQEIAVLTDLAGKKPGIVSVEVSAFGPQRTVCGQTAGRVPDGYGGTFPLFCRDDSPWCCGDCRGSC